MKKYYKRIVEDKINRKLRTSGAVLVTGPKYSGKTTTCMPLQKSNISLIDNEIIEIVAADPKIALSGEFPRLIDEWQNVPNLWNLVRQEVDKNGTLGEYILTGSSTPTDSNQIHHTGAGRISTVKMRPLSLYESHDSTGLVSLKDLFNSKDYTFFDQNEKYSLEDTAFYICRGGWPQSIVSNKDDALEITKNYYDGLFNFRSSGNQDIKNKRPELFKNILRSYARNISTEASYSVIMEDLRNSSIGIDAKTFNTYLDIAKDLFIIEDIDAWMPNLRSKTAIRTTPTRHFVDTSIACRALYTSPKDILNDAKTFGLLFEDLAIRDLKIYSDAIDGTVKHYRDKNDLEVDAIIHLDDGRWGAIEIKLGSPQGIADGIKNLLKLEASIAEDFKKPAFKMVLTACGKAYKTSEGVYVCPINLLKN